MVTNFDMGKKAPKPKASASSVRPRFITSHSSVSEVQAVAKRAPRRQLQRRDTDEQVNRAIQCHFRGMSKVALETKKVGNMLLRQRIARDLRATRLSKNKTRMSSSYWRDLRRTYGESTGLEDVEIAESEVSQSGLKRAMAKLCCPQIAARSSEPMQAFLSACGSLSRRDAYGVAKMIAEPKLLTKKHNDEACVALMSCMLRLGVVEKVKDIFACIKDSCDVALTCLWKTAERAGVQMATWCQVPSFLKKRKTTQSKGVGTFNCECLVRSSVIPGSVIHSLGKTWLLQVQGGNSC